MAAENGRAASSEFPARIADALAGVAPTARDQRTVSSRVRIAEPAYFQRYRYY